MKVDIRDFAHELFPLFHRYTTEDIGDVIERVCENELFKNVVEGYNKLDDIADSMADISELLSTLKE